MITPAHQSIDLRRGIDYIGVTLGAVIHDGHGNRLLMRRGPHARDEHGTWDNTGGAVEFGEELEDTLRRELLEELCTEPIAIEYLGMLNQLRTDTEGRPTHWIGLYYAVQVDPGKVKIGEPHKIAELGWFTSKNLPTPLHSQLLRSHALAEARGIII